MAKKEPRYAPGHELTLHPGDPVRGADVLEQRRKKEAGEVPTEPQPEPAEQSGAEGTERLRF